MNIIQSILTKNPCYTAGQKITPKGLMLHSVGCPQPSASVFVKNWNSASYNNACVHGFIDANTGDIYQTLPWNHRGWHAGGSANNTHIGVEMCEPDCIKYTGGSTFTCSNKEKAKTMVTRTYNAAVELFAYLCKEYGLDPTADGVIISHKEGHKRGVASNHGDPEHLWTQLGMGYTMGTFRAAVKAAMGTASPATPEKPEQTTSGTIKKGDVVTIAANATYYNGKAIPAWVKAKKWIVKSVSGDRAVIDQSTDGKNAICSPVNVKYLTADKPYYPDVGDVVNCLATKHYTSANATAGKTCKPGRARVTSIYQLGKSKHPYHVVAESGSGSNLYGWVDADTITKV